MAKLLRKNILKLIRNLKSGQYRKGTQKLVSNDGTKFCCLGVYADQQGCTWDTQHNHADGDVLIPIPKGRVKPEQEQGYGSLSGRLTCGLTAEMQSMLMDLNDENKNWKPVIKYLQDEVLPKAK